MKKLAALVCALALAMGMAPPARAVGTVGIRFYDEKARSYAPAVEAPVVNVTFDRVPMELDVPAVARTMEGDDARTMVPVRPIAEALGATVLWFGENRQVVLFHGEDTIVLNLGSPVATVNGDVVELPGGVPADIALYDGVERTMVPLRFVSEQLKAEVGWDNGSYTASVNTGKEGPEEPFVPAPVPEPTPAPEPRADLTGKIVTIDPGHGGWSSGASYEGIDEKDIDLAVSQLVAGMLRETGCTVVMTREDDTYVDLYDRCTIANKAGADIFVSIHSNASEKSKTFQGTYTYYYRGNNIGVPLAQTIQDAAVAAAGSVDRGIMDANFVVLRETWMPAALVELGFMTCHEELMRLNDPEYQEKLARGIAEGIIEYLAPGQ